MGCNKRWYTSVTWVIFYRTQVCWQTHRLSSLASATCEGKLPNPVRGSWRCPQPPPTKPPPSAALVGPAFFSPGVPFRTCTLHGMFFKKSFLVAIQCCPNEIMGLFCTRNTAMECTDRWLADFCARYVTCNWKIIRWSICFLLCAPQFSSLSMVFKNFRHFLGVLINH